MSDKDKDYPEEFLQALKELEEEGIIEEYDNE
jgi:hypothetical protein